MTPSIEGAVLLGQYRPHSPEWFAARAGVMTGSRIAAVLGLSPYESPFSLYHRMVGSVGDQATAVEAEWGTHLEPAVLAKFRDEHPELRCSKTGTWANLARPWQAGNPDSLVFRKRGRIVRGIVEAKTSPRADGWGEPGTDEIPVYYRCQILWYLDTLGLTTCWLPVLIRGTDYREYVVRADTDEAQADIATLRAAGRAFLDRVARRDAPDLDSHGETYQVQRQLNPAIDGTTVDLTVDEAAIVRAAKACEAIAADQITAARVLLADRMGSAKTAVDPDGKKVADRRAKSLTSTPYVQIASLPKQAKKIGEAA